MRCSICGWIVGADRCPCGASRTGALSDLIPIGAQVLARAGRGPSMTRWDHGEVLAHQGPIHQVETTIGVFWCEADDLLADSPQRSERLIRGARAWGLWLDGRWYPGTIAETQGPLRKMRWEDGDQMWLETANLVLLAMAAAPPRIGEVVSARQWDGEFQPGTVDQEEDGLFRVTFAGGEEGWVPAADLKTFPPNPFRESGI